FVYLDMTHLRASAVQKRFHRIYETCMAHNLDITEDVIPVRPAEQFCMGGVRTDLNGKTNVGGLYAAGEVAATGVHGANRLPSNAALEGLVYGARSGMQKAVKTLEEMAPKLRHPKTRRAYEAANLHLTASLVARSALAREESRGAHYRMEYPDHDDKKFLKHSVVRGEKVVFLT